MGGGSKDEQDIPNWKHRGGEPPDKDDITNAYAAAYQNPDNGNLILTFGIDRFDTSGDAQLGFWFFQQNIQPVAGGTFNGVHQDGDILVLVNFSGGGDVPTIEVFRWQGTGPVSLGAGAEVLCTGGFIPAGFNFCGITNSASVAAPWPYQTKGVGVTTQFPPAAFFEGAIDLTALGIAGCFTQFLAESRSSTSITAVLKDFATPASGFNLCGIDVTKACTNPRLVNEDTQIRYDIGGTVENIGFGQVFDIALSDVPAADAAFQRVNCATSAVLGSFPFAGPLAAGGEVCYRNTITVPLAQNGLMDTVTATANTESGGGLALTDSATAQCPNLQVSPDLSVTKDCESSVEVIGGQVVAQVTVSGQVCNIGTPGDGRLTGVTVDDLNETTDPDPLLSGQTLLEGQCLPYEGTYTPSVANDANGDPTTDPSLVRFVDTVRATGNDVFGAPVTPQTDMADCPLCP